MIGGYQMNFNLLIAGRVLFGCGCECMYVGQSAIASNWFINYELPLAMSVISCIPLLGSFVGGAVVPATYIDNDKSFGAAFRVGFLFAVFCFFIVVIIWILDYKTDKHDEKKLNEY